MDHDHKLEEKYEGLLPDAIIFAFNAHSGQYRKLSPQQYIIHPLRVSEFLLKNFSHHSNINEMRIAAVLHDTVEDTWASIKDIEKEFGNKIARIVFEVSKPEGKDKKEIHIKYLELLKNSSDEAKIIKLADIFDNAILSTDNNPKWKSFLLESKETLELSELKKEDKIYETIKRETLKIINKKLKDMKTA